LLAKLSSKARSSPFGLSFLALIQKSNTFIVQEMKRKITSSSPHQVEGVRAKG
jgi:hypothetical protein